MSIGGPCLDRAAIHWNAPRHAGPDGEKVPGHPPHPLTENSLLPGVPGEWQTIHMPGSDGSPQIEKVLDPPAHFFGARPGNGSPLRLSRHKMITHEALKNDRMTVNVGLLNRRSSDRSYGWARRRSHSFSERPLTTR
jgi:hypothetical protein